MQSVINKSIAFANDENKVYVIVQMYYQDIFKMVSQGYLIQLTKFTHNLTPMVEFKSS